MNENKILDEVTALLFNSGYINHPEKMPLRKPTHGNCCTCQDCGYGHDECVCEDNQLIENLTVIFKTNNG